MPLAETETILKKLSQVKNDPENDITATRVLPHSERQALIDEQRSNKETLEHMRVFKSGAGSKEIVRRTADITNKLRRESPKEISGGARDELVKEADRILQNDILPGMQSKEEMRRNEPGAVGRLIEWETPERKAAISKWKNIMRTIEPDNDDPDFTNLERHRPSKMQPGTSTFSANGQISGLHAMTPQAKENWPEGLGENTNSALNQVIAAASASGLEVVLRPANGSEPEKQKKEPGFKGPYTKVCPCCNEEFVTEKAAKVYKNESHRQKFFSDKAKNDKERAEKLKADFAMTGKEGE